MNHKVIIIDDEAPARAIIREYLCHHEGLICVEECRDGFEGAKAIQTHKPDLVFLDIQMPKISGLEMLEVLDMEAMPFIIFTTAHDEFAIRAFELNAVDYLLKPIARKRFDHAVEKVLERIRGGQDGRGRLLKMMEMDDPGKSWLDRIVLKSGNEIHLIPEEEVCCIEAQDDYVLVCTSREEYLKKKTLKYYEGKLNPAMFLKVHRSFIVRIDAIQRLEPYSRDAYVAFLKNGRKISVSKQGYAALKEVFDF